MTNLQALFIVLLFMSMGICSYSKLIFSDDFNTFDLKKWKHDITLSGGGNW